MTKKTKRLHQFAKLPLAVVIAASLSTSASAFQFYLGDVEASLDTTLSAGASWRVQDRASWLVGVGNGGTGGSINSDDGNLNTNKGQTYSKIVKGNTEFLLKYNEWGAFARATYWYDIELKNERRATDVNGYQRELSPQGRENASGAQFLDAYIWRDFWIGDMPLNVRVGKQVVSWGESTFIFNGINVINPVDIGAFRNPGAEIKDALLPVNMVYGSLGLTDNVTVEAFVQLKYEKTKIEDCGTFFSTVDYVADGCGPVYLLNGQSEKTNREGLAGNPNLATRLSRGADKEPNDTDQYGLAVRWYAQALNETEFGLYLLQYHSRAPLVSGTVARDTGNGAGGAPDGKISTDEIINTSNFFIEYPQRIQMLGLSFNTTGPFGVSLAGEYSFKHNMPVQLNSPDLVAGAAGRSLSPVFQHRVPDLVHTDGTPGPDGIINLKDAIAANFLGSVQKGYDLFNVSQLQVTAIQFLDQVLGASRLTFVGEVGGTYVHNLPPLSKIRYGRFDQLSFGLTPDYNLTDTKTALQDCQSINKIGQCNTDGYVTSFSWGYRLRTSLKYDNAFAGVNLTPQLSWAQDVKGYAPGPGANFIEGRKTVALALKADYLNKYSANIAYTNYFGGGKSNALADRDNVALSVSYSF